MRMCRWKRRVKRRGDLAWRSPNNRGDDVVLEPRPKRHVPKGHGKEVWPRRDCTLLPERADQQRVQYSDRVDHEQVGISGRRWSGK